MTRDVFAGLNEEQRLAVEATTGPVSILAGAGSGKTTTLTRRIANQVVSGGFKPSEILAVTFTDKAAKEMASRLEGLAVGAIRCRTFHSEALNQLHVVRDAKANILPSKFWILKSIVETLMPPYKFTAVRDVAAEIERAKNLRVPPKDYLDKAVREKPPLPAELMADVYREYERKKSRATYVDFEDLLELTIRMFEDGQTPGRQIASRYKAFSVDEYQDVNLLQQTLLDHWLDGREEICVVGDDYQSIYSFTGATPRYLLDFQAKFPSAAKVVLTKNYRSTPQILSFANGLVPRLRGTAKRLEPTCASGPKPLLKSFDSAEAELAWIVRKVEEQKRSNIPLEEMAILYRINARSEDFEEAFTQAGIPFQVQDSPFLQRPAAKTVLSRLRRDSGTDVVDSVSKLVHELGLDQGEEFDGEEATRQADLARLLRLAEEFPGEGGTQGFVEDLISRFTTEQDGRGVQLLTYHRAKGKEYEVVFLPRLEEGELPFVRAEEDVDEERRLLYVGITRAKKLLFVSWATERQRERRPRREPSRFLNELEHSISSQRAGLSSSRSKPGNKQRGPGTAPAVISVARQDVDLFDRLKAWSRAASPKNSVPTDQVLARVARRRPTTFSELLDVPGVTGTHSALFGLDILAIVEKAGPSRSRKSASIEGATVSLEDLRQKHPKAYERWTNEEEALLIKEFEAGKGIEALAAELGRQKGGITSRLRKLGLID